jgi:hypothetical protein
MIRRDYILRMVEQLAQMLARIREQMVAKNYAQAGQGLDEAFLSLTGLGAEAVGRLSDTELLARLTIEGPTQVVRVKAAILVALLQEAGELHVAAGRETEGRECWLKALNLLLTLRMEGEDFEPPEKIDFLRDELRGGEIPLGTLAALWRHYENIGAYGRAEDALSDLREAEPENAALLAEARAFYERLLVQTDRTLEDGNLPRAEVEEALAELRKMPK